jgi:catechol 2,3-dioxygenase-like lactoylglutathione lyase family enzyme
MADLRPFTTSSIHHIALRVENVEAGKNWLTTVLGFRVQRELQLGRHNVVFLLPAGANAPIIDLIGGPVDQRQLPDNIPDIMKLSGWHHLCLQVPNLEECMTDLRRRDVKILIDVMDGAPEIGVEKLAFIADPWGNIYELLQVADGENPTVPR